MGALHGLDVPALFPVLEVRSFGVRALGSGSHELLWIVSSLDAAGYAARGQPIEWLSRSLVQDNTPHYRRSVADRVIGQVEIALRDLLDLHVGQQSDDGGADQLWPPASLAKMRDRARQEGHDANSLRDVLDYAYLIQLGDAIVARPAWFGDGCVPNRDVLRQALSGLNRVRRKVAHHREVSNDELVACRQAADDVLAPLAKAHPVLASDFLVDRWDERVQEIASAAQRAVESPSVPESGAVSEPERRVAAVAALEVQLDAVESAWGALERPIVPVQRRELHRLARAAFERWSRALRALLDVAARPNLTISEAEAAQVEYQAALADIRDLRATIQAIRVGMSSAEA